MNLIPSNNLKEIISTAYELIIDQIRFKSVRKPIGDISLDGLGQDWALRRYILHLNDI